MELDAAIRNFGHGLVAGYPSWLRAAHAALAAGNGYLDQAFDDWAQAQWELLVERTVLDQGEFLDLCGSGSDYETELHSRVFFHDATPTHEVGVASASGRQTTDVLSGAAFDPSTMQFEQLVAYRADWYESEPPFDHVLLVTDSDGLERVAPLADVRFCLRRLATT